MLRRWAVITSKANVCAGGSDLSAEGMSRKDGESLYVSELRRSMSTSVYALLKHAKGPGESRNDLQVYGLQVKV